MAIYQKKKAEADVNVPTADHVALFIDEDGLAYLKNDAAVVTPLKGDTGAAGVGVPTGGVAGDYLRKQSSTDYNTAFSAIPQSDIVGLVANLAAKDAVDTSLDSRVGALEFAPPAHIHPESDVVGLESDLATVDTRLDALESVAPPPEAQGTWLVSGGSVVYLQDLDFRVSAASYYINGVHYTAPQTDVTLDAADPTDERFDAIVANSSGVITHVTGVAQANPPFPDIDPETEIVLLYIHVNGGATDPGITLVDLYREDAEWTSSVSANFNAGSTNNPLNGTKDIEATAAAAGNFARLTNGTAITLSDKKQVTFNIRSKATWPNPKTLQLTWYNTGVKKGQSVAFGNGKYGFNSSNITTYQQIVIPISAFGVSSVDTVDRFEFLVAGGGGTIGFYIDDVILEVGSDNTAQPSIGAATTSSLGLVRIDKNDANPVVYLKSSVDALIAGSIPESVVDAKGDLVVGVADNTTSRLGVGSDSQRLRANSGEATGLEWVYELAEIPFLIDGGGSAIAAGIKGDVVLPAGGGVITGWTLLADQSGSIVVDTWMDTYANYPPTNADTIWGGSKPTLAVATKNQATGLSIAFSGVDILRFNVDSATTVQRVTISLSIIKA